MDAGSLLLRLALVIVAARAAAEIAERFKQPAVLAEIAAGVIIGPSALNLVRSDDVLRALGELGAVLLLFEVGLHMDLRELRRVGRSALQVAMIGVAVPMAIGYPVLLALGVSSRVAVFLAAGITATSVGITARVFSDLRALATTEARTVLGAAVADDVAGLVILAIVVGAESDQGVALGSLAGTIALALGFLAAATVLGVWLVPRLIGKFSRLSRTDGTPMILALAVALSLAGLSNSVKLAPVVGAFVAGLAVGPSTRREEIQRRLAPIGQVLIPLFFLLIGLETRASAFGEPRVLGIAGALAGVAIIGKVVAGLGAKSGAADRVLIGIAMIPRGEVGLIFASIGLTRHVLDARAHGILVVVVMISTVVAPPLIRWRIRSGRRAARGVEAAAEPDGGWLSFTGDVVDLVAEPPPELAPLVGFEAAVATTHLRPGPRLLEWLSSIPPSGEPELDEPLREAFFRLLREGDVRSWRFLELTGLLERVLPDLEEAVKRRGRDVFDLDPAGALRWETLEGVRALESDLRDPASKLLAGLPSADLIRLAALARDAFDEEDAIAKLDRLAGRLALEGESADTVRRLVVDRHLLKAASRRLDMGSEDQVLELAAHLSPELADALYVLAVAEDAMDRTERERLDELHALVRRVLDQHEVAELAGGDVLEKRRQDARRAIGTLLPERLVEDHLDDAPARYLLAQPPEAIARHIRLVETKPVRDETRLFAEPGPDPSGWTVHVAFLDRHGGLAAVAGAFASRGVSVQEAFVSTWRSGVAIDVFKVIAARDLDWDGVRDAITARLAGTELNGGPVAVEGSVEIDNEASPWHTIIEVHARDRSGLLYRVAAALARAGADIHMAQVSTRDGVAVDTFSVTGAHGGKLDEAGQRAVRAAFAGKVPLRLRGPLRRFTRTGRG